MTDTTAAVEPPVLGLGPGGLQPYTMALQSIAYAVREARWATGRRAWSDRESSDRDSALAQRIADPPVRAMTGVERDTWIASVHTLGPVDGSPPHGASVRRAETPHGAVVVTVAPMPLHPDAWGLHAIAYPGRSPGEPAGPGGSGQPPVQNYVRCVDEIIAQRLGDDILARGPAAVHRLDQFAGIAAERAAAAAAGLIEDGHQRQLRVAEVLRSHWSQHPQLVEQMLRPTEAHRAQGHRWNPAFGALCHRIAQLEERGYTVADVLDVFLRPSVLTGPDIINPSAFAEHLLQKVTPDESLEDDVRLDREAATTAAANAAPPAAGDSSAAQQPTRGGARDPVAQQHRSEQRRRIEVRDTVVEPALTHAVDTTLLARLRGCRTFDLLIDELSSRHLAGLDLTEHLTGLPTRRIAAAGDPVLYLRAVLKNRAAAAAAARPDAAGATAVAAEATRPIGIDRAAMADLLCRGGGAEFADIVTTSPSWPRLAERMQGWVTHGRPVGAAVAALSHARVVSAADPARFALQLLNARLGPLAAAGITAGRAGDPADANTAHSPAPELEAVAQGRIDWRDLDPSSAVDRVGLEAARGQGAPADDAAIDDAITAALTTPAAGGDGEAYSGPVNAEHIDAGVAGEYSAAAVAAARADRAFTPPVPGPGRAPRRRPSPTPRQPVRPVPQHTPSQSHSQRPSDSQARGPNRGQDLPTESRDRGRRR